MEDDTTTKKTRKNNRGVEGATARNYHRKGRFNAEGNTVYEAQEFNPRINPGNKRFNNYRPRWFFDALQRKELSPEDFVLLRKHVLCMSMEQCAAYLRVNRQAVWNWETRRQPIPFMAYELLRFLSETTNFKMSHPEWEGWGVNRDGELYNPDNTVILNIDALRNFEHLMRNVVPHIRRENVSLKMELENTRAQLNRLTALLSEFQKVAPLDLAKVRIQRLFDPPRLALPAPAPRQASGAHAVAKWFARVSGLRARLKSALGYGGELDR